MHNQLIVIAFVSVSIVSCSNPAKMNDTITTTNRTSLVIESDTVARPSEFRAQARVVNPGPGDLYINTYVLSLPVFALEIHNAQGETVPHLPPPMPRRELIDSGQKMLEEGTSLEWKLQGLAVDASILGKGDFKVRLVVKGKRDTDGTQTPVELYSDWVSFTVP